MTGAQVERRADPSDLEGFTSGLALSMEEPEHEDWVWEGMLARGCLTGLSAIPKAGKSTLVGDLLQALGDGPPVFLGRMIRPVPVVLVTEEPSAVLRPRLDGWSEAALANLTIRHRRGLWREVEGKRKRWGWEENVAHAVRVAHLTNAGLIVFDTVRGLAGGEIESENDAGPMQDALAHAQGAAAEGFAVLVIHHNRKGEGEHGEQVSGNNAFVGALDNLFTLTRKGAGGGNRRRLEILGRWGQHAEIVELGENGYEVVGTVEDVKAAAERTTRANVGGLIMTALSNAPAERVSAQWVHGMVVGINGKPGLSTVKAVLRDLVTTGRIEREGGTRGKPLVFRPLASETNGIETETAGEPLELVA